MSNCSIWPIDRTLSDATTPGQSVPEKDGNEGVLHISLSITGASPSDCLMSYQGHSLSRGLPSWLGCQFFFPDKQKYIITVARQKRQTW